MRGKLLMILICAAVLAAPACADVPVPPTTQDVDDPPIPPQAAAGFAQIIRHMLLTLQLTHRALGEIPLNETARQKAMQHYESLQQEMRSLLDDMRVGRMPSQKRLLAIPLKAAINKGEVEEILGVEQYRELRDAMDSFRYLGRFKLGELRLALDELQLVPEQKTQVEAIVAELDRQVEKLPAGDVDFEKMEETQNRVAEIFVIAHDRLAKVLTPRQQEQLGTDFAVLAAERADTQPASQPATQPAAGQ